MSVAMENPEREEESSYRECDRCGQRKPLFRDVTWLDETRKLCPVCWKDCKSWIEHSRVKIEERRELREAAPWMFDGTPISREENERYKEIRDRILGND